jgi:predicted nucleotidyltransferase component of viral defense system
LKVSNRLNLTEKQQFDLFSQIASQTGLPAYAIEKDAWVTLILRMLFRSEISSHLVFKGGTSLSKAYNLIERFSEDIDLAIDRNYLGFSGDLTKGQIRKLRRKSHDFSANELPQILQKELSEYGIEKDLYKISVPNIKISDQDPEVIHIVYKSVFKEESYLQSKVLLELGARSLMEPYESKNIRSLIDESYPDAEFHEGEFMTNTVIPEKTFLEKLILLHEEFQKPKDKVKYHRMSRHLYDIEQIIKTDYGKRALKNNELFENICIHREKFTPLKTLNYKNLKIDKLNFLPPAEFMDLYRTDYKEMQTSMIYGNSPDFDLLIENIKTNYHK